MPYLLVAVNVLLTMVSYGRAKAVSASASDDACAVLSPADISKATALKVGTGVAGAPVPGTLGRCTWTASDNRIIVTLADAAHMQITIAAQEGSGGTSVSGLGSKAVAVKAAAFTGGGYIVSVLDAKGGFGVSLLGPAGTLDRVVGLAKVVESHR